ncbi:hypothetical protein Mnod_3228 [Methylobacterium nodulans ORS 2060]|uniref:Uncharacterized protein n=1 Tax=Methylobacterium nodulans (strain LMG 21967 / CNCM I-2342 / ORS 2060) TaxID=460265 RepID=B8IKW5_METNO|nr:hypothetical protein Mnod_3228 [Methylobacterium nodulans ORS 2060]
MVSVHLCLKNQKRRNQSGRAHDCHHVDRMSRRIPTVHHLASPRDDCGHEQKKKADYDVRDVHGHQTFGAPVKKRSEWSRVPHVR